MELTAAFPEVHQPIVHPGDEIPNEKSGHKAICEPDQAPDERHPVPDKELAKESKMWSHNLPPLEEEPIGGNEN